MNEPLLLVESIRCERGILFNLEGHNRRLNSSRRELFGATDAWDLTELVKIPASLGPGLFKCRVVYAEKILKIEFLPYEKKTVKRLRMVKNDTINYAYKYQDRTALDRLKALAGGGEDIIIVKNSLATDASSSNIVFDTGSELLTPAFPLLRGTRRELLLSKGILKTADIRPADIRSFRSVHLINAMLDLGETTVPVTPDSIFE
jgi:4-amino-4-deoxychorismate lyase